MSTTLTIEVPVHFQRCGHGSRKHMPPGVAAAPMPPGRVPRVARLMALALRLDELVRTGPIGSRLSHFAARPSARSENGTGSLP
jgi:hypothetical protein